MLRTENTNMNMSGSISNADINIANVSANFNGTEDFYLSANILNYADFMANKEVFFTDLKAFVEQMLNAIVDLKKE